MKLEQLDNLMEGLPPPPDDTLDLYIEVDEENLHLIDDIIKGYDGIANVRREYRVNRGQKQFRILVMPSFVDELKKILRGLRKYVYIGEIIIEGKSNGC